ncbi:MAG: ATP synthase subunit I [Sulfurifustis sp.]
MATLVKDNDFSPRAGLRSVFLAQNRPIRTVLYWQTLVTVISVLMAAYFAGVPGAISAALGGAVSIAAGVAFAWVASRGRTTSAAGALFAALRAEGVRVAVIVALLWIVFATYKDLVALAFIATFIVTVVIFSMAFFVRDQQSRGGNP